MISLFTALLFSLSAQTPAQSQPATQAPSASPVVVVGCLQSSTVNGRDQFTLISRDTNRAQADVKTLTYQLTPAGGVDLKSNVGRRVEVTGTEARTGVEATQTETSRATQSPTGTSGRTPTVQTEARADIVLRQLNVSAVKPVAGDCRLP